MHKITLKAVDRLGCNFQCKSILGLQPNDYLGPQLFRELKGSPEGQNFIDDLTQAVGVDQ